MKIIGNEYRKNGIIADGVSPIFLETSISLRITWRRFFLNNANKGIYKIIQKLYFEIPKFFDQKLMKHHNIAVSQKTVGEKFFFKKEMVIFVLLSNFFY